MSSTNLAIPLLVDSQSSKYVTVNDAINLLDEAMNSLLAVTMTDADYTFTGGASLEAAAFVMSGTLTAGRNVIVPNNEKFYVFENSTTGGFAITVKTAAGTGIAVAAGSGLNLLYCNGTNVVAVGSSGGGGGASVFGPSGSGHTTGLVPDPGATAGTTKFLREDATFAAPPSGPSVFVASGSGHATGLVPDPGATAGTTKYLREDATFDVPPGSSSFVASGSGHAGGTVPDPGATAGTTKYLREDATFAVPSGGGGGGATIPTFVYPSVPQNVGSALDGYTWFGANVIGLFEFILPAGITFSKLCYNVQAADSFSGSLVDIGIYDASGNLVANIGPTFNSATGVKSPVVLQSSVTLAPGLYFLAITGAYGFASVQLQSTTICFASRPLVSSTASSAGTLPGTVAIPAAAAQSDNGNERQIPNFALM